MRGCSCDGLIFINFRNIPVSTKFSASYNSVMQCEQLLLQEFFSPVHLSALTRLAVGLL